MNKSTTSGTHTRVCTDCREERTLDCFFKDRSRKSGYRSRCKLCETTARGYTPKSPSWYEEEAERRKLLARGKSKCTTCHDVKLVSEFHRHAGQLGGICSTCKICAHERRVAWYRKNTTRARAGARAWALEHPAQTQQRVREWSRRWPERRREIVRKSSRKRRAQKKAVYEVFTTAMERFVFQFWNHRCAVCGGTKTLCIDHWRPLSSGYGLTMTNAVLLCCSCNSKKHAKRPKQCYTPQFVAVVEQRLCEQEQRWLALPLTSHASAALFDLDSIGAF